MFGCGAVGGNGGNAAANAIQKECEQQKVLCSVVGVPKSIDNDILLVRSTCHSDLRAVLTTSRGYHCEAAQELPCGPIMPCPAHARAANGQVAWAESSKCRDASIE